MLPRSRAAAFLAFLLLTGLLPMPARARARENADPGAWGQEQNGVRTRLVPVGSAFSLGRPMRVRLEIENVGEKVVRFDAQQADVNGSLILRTPDGAEAPYIAAGVQTAGGPRPLKPGERAALFDKLDIAEQYLIDEPGEYSVRFRGLDEGFGEIPIPPSNTITIKVAQGPIPTSRLFARQLLEILPAPAWRVSVDREGELAPFGRGASTGTSLVIDLVGRSKIDSARIFIWVVSKPAPISIEKSRDRTGVTAEEIGRCEWGSVYIWAGDGIQEKWPDFRAKIIAALKVKPA
jgi:hypothetical protein